MALTNIRNDYGRLEKEMQILTEEGRYMLNVPGPGANAPYLADPFIRLQKWGANIRNNTINVESNLMGLSQKLTRDCLNFRNNNPYSCQIQYNTSNPFVDQTRTTNPAWILRTRENNRWDYLPINPLNHTDIPFDNNLSTRIIEKENYCP